METPEGDKAITSHSRSLAAEGARTSVPGQASIRRRPYGRQSLNRGN